MCLLYSTDELNGEDGKLGDVSEATVERIVVLVV